MGVQSPSTLPTEATGISRKRVAWSTEGILVRKIGID